MNQKLHWQAVNMAAKHKDKGYQSCVSEIAGFAPLKMCSCKMRWGDGGTNKTGGLKCLRCKNWIYLPGTYLTYEQAKNMKGVKVSYYIDSKGFKGRGFPKKITDSFLSRMKINENVKVKALP